MPKSSKPHLAVGGDEDVGRLQVAVDHEPAVRERDSARDVEQQLQACPDAEAVLAAIHIDRLALDVFEREKRPTLGRRCLRRTAARCSGARARPGCRAHAPCARLDHEPRKPAAASAPPAASVFRRRARPATPNPCHRHRVRAATDRVRPAHRPLGRSRQVPAPDRRCAAACQASARSQRPPSAAAANAAQASEPHARHPACRAKPADRTARSSNARSSNALKTFQLDSVRSAAAGMGCRF